MPFPFSILKNYYFSTFFLLLSHLMNDTMMYAKISIGTASHFSNISINTVKIKKLNTSVCSLYFNDLSLSENIGRFVTIIAATNIAIGSKKYHLPSTNTWRPMRIISHLNSISVLIESKIEVMSKSSGTVASINGIDAINIAQAGDANPLKLCACSGSMLNFASLNIANTATKMLHSNTAISHGAKVKMPPRSRIDCFRN